MNYAGGMKLAPLALILTLAAMWPEIGLGTDMTHAVKVNLVGMKVPGKPPLERLLVDVHIQNEEKAPRWVLLPSHLPIWVKSGGIDKLEQLTAKSGDVNVAIGKFLGTGGRYALLLAPGASVTLRKLEVGWWEPDKDKEIAFDVQFASDVTLGGNPMASWFDKDPTIQGTVEVDMESAKHSHSHSALQGKEVAVAVTGATTTSLKLPPP